MTFRGTEWVSGYCGVPVIAFKWVGTVGFIKILRLLRGPKDKRTPKAVQRSLEKGDVRITFHHFVLRELVRYRDKTDDWLSSLTNPLMQEHFLRTASTLGV